MDHIVARIIVVKCISPNTPNVITVISINTNQRPRVIKKPLSSFFVFLLLCNHAETPERKTKVGAQKCVTHLVKYNIGVVVAGLSGSPVNASLWKKSRV